MRQPGVPRFRNGAGFSARRDEVRGAHRAFLTQVPQSKADESKELVSVDALDKIVEQELKMKMTDQNANSRAEILFVFYHSLLRRMGLTWLLQSNQRFCVYHVLSAIRLHMLQDGLTSDLEFVQVNLKKYFNRFL